MVIMLISHAKKKFYDKVINQRVGIYTSDWTVANFQSEISYADDEHGRSNDLANGRASKLSSSGKRGRCFIHAML